MRKLRFVARSFPAALMGRRKREAQVAPTLGYESGFSQAYQLERELGRGGNGVVCLATHVATGAIQAS